MRRLWQLLAAGAWLAQAAANPDPVSLEEAQRELFGARYKQAAELYSKAIEANPKEAEAYYGLVRALVRDHRSREAYSVSEKALALSPQTAATQTAAGMAAYRKGDLPGAEQYFRSALRMDINYAGALSGLARICGNVSQFKKAKEFDEAAYRSSPHDPEAILAHANHLRRAQHVAALEQALAILDSSSEEARNLKAHVAKDRALGERKVRQVMSPYRDYKLKMLEIMNGPRRAWAFGVQARLNQQKSVRLMLDTGASGIAVSPKEAERAGLERLGSEASEAKGIGDGAAQAAYGYFATEVRIGDLVLGNYPVTAFKSAYGTDFDGLIGADVFKDFVATLDFPRLEITLAPRPGGVRTEDAEPMDAVTPPADGMYRVFRFGDHLVLPTTINGGKPHLFLVDSGSATNLIDTTIGGETAKMHHDDTASVQGVQGKTKQASRADRVTLVFAGFRQENVDIRAIDLERPCDDFGVAFGGILGVPVLGQIKMTVDYEQGTIRLEARK
jgi:tetratricopeptide (TPR) repeat protein